MNWFKYNAIHINPNRLQCMTLAKLKWMQCFGFHFIALRTAYTLQDYCIIMNFFCILFSHSFCCYRCHCICNRHTFVCFKWNRNCQHKKNSLDLGFSHDLCAMVKWWSGFCYGTLLAFFLEFCPSLFYFLRRRIEFWCAVDALWFSFLAYFSIYLPSKYAGLALFFLRASAYCRWRFILICNVYLPCWILFLFRVNSHRNVRIIQSLQTFHNKHFWQTLLIYV